MSLSQPKLINPCKKFIEYKGKTGVFQYWDKEAKKNVDLPNPIKFIVLDELSCIKGFHDASQSGIYSNEVHSLSKQPLLVRTFKGREKIEGIYAEIKGQIKIIGGKFCKSVYAAIITGNEVELVNFQFLGASGSSWMDKDFDVTQFGVSVDSKNHTKKKKGDNNFLEPKFESFSLSRDLMDKAIELDKQLQKFLSSYEKQVPEGVQDDAPEDLDEPKTWKDVLVHKCADSSLIGMKLGELETFQIEAMHDSFKPKAKNGEYNEKDLILNQALVCWKKEMDELV